MDAINLLRIADETSNGQIMLLAFDLLQVLEQTLPEGEKLVWSIVGDIDILYKPGKRARAAREKIFAGETLVQGVFPVSWDELFSLAEAIRQTSDIIVAGRNMSAPAPMRTYDRKFDNDLLSASEIIIQAVESSFWFVYCKDEAIASRYRRAFNDITDVSYRLVSPTTPAAS